MLPVQYARDSAFAPPTSSLGRSDSLIPGMVLYSLAYARISTKESSTKHFHLTLDSRSMRQSRYLKFSLRI